jgi:hypothetical protein
MNEADGDQRLWFAIDEHTAGTWLRSPILVAGDVTGTALGNGVGLLLLQ